MIKVKDGYAKLIGTTYQGSATQVLLSNGGNLEFSSATKANTLVQRNASQHIYATYFNSAISDEALTDIGSVYVRNTSDTFIRRISKTQFYSIIDDKFVTLDTAQTITGVKTFAASPILNASIPIIQKQGDFSNYTTAIKWYKGGASQGTYDPQIGQHNTGGDGKGSICILPYPTETSPWGGTVGLFISKGVLKLDGKSVALAENYYTKTESDERYVNVTGDTMTGPLIVKATVTGTQLISTIATGTSPLKVTSTTVVTNLNSDLFDGFHETAFVRSFWTSSPGYDCSKYNSRPLISFTYSNNAPFTGGFIDVVTNGYGFYLGTSYTSNAPLYYKRHGISSDGGMGTWQQLARITDNVASATKLQTARTINGTSFDGTANIVTAYWGTARTISLSGAVTGSASVNGSQNVTITTTYQFGSIDGRYVTLTTAQTVSGVKTFSTQQKFTVATGTSPFTVTSTTVVTNLNSDLLDGRHLGNATGRIPYIVSFPAYSSFGSSTSTLDYEKNILKWIWTNQNHGGDTLLIGVGRPNSKGNLQIQLYGTNGVNSSTGYPRYSSAIYYPLGGRPICFGTTDYNFYSYSLAFSDDIKDPANYYWANIKVSASSSTATQPTFNTCYTSDWFRSTGNTGWYSQTHGGGWYMTDSTYIRAYGDKRVYTANPEQYAFYTAGGMTAVKGFWHSAVNSNSYVLLAGGSYKNLSDFAKGNAGSATKGVYVTGGTVTAMTYSLSSNLNSGTSGKLAYYSSATTVAAYSSSVGSSAQPIYLNAGSPSASSYSFTGTYSNPVIVWCGEIYRSTPGSTYWYSEKKGGCCSISFTTNNAGSNGNLIISIPHCEPYAAFCSTVRIFDGSTAISAGDGTISGRSAGMGDYMTICGVSGTTGNVYIRKFSQQNAGNDYWRNGELGTTTTSDGNKPVARFYLMIVGRYI